jgi:hypothetical protein
VAGFQTFFTGRVWTFGDNVSKARRVIDAFKEDDTIDALGFQRISERFDEWCYPAVTTPMTRARYYLFVPAIYSYLERQHLGLQGFRDRAAGMQHELRRILVQTERTKKGVIGEKAEEGLKRLPSSLYWSSLGDLGLLKRNADGTTWSEAQYQRVVNTDLADVAIHTDEGIQGEESGQSSWNALIPVGSILKARGGLKERLRFTLTSSEAAFLVDCFLRMPSGPGSVLGLRLRQRLAGPYDYVWDVPSGHAPPALRTMLKHARSFSAAARGLSLVYYAMLTEEQLRLRVGGADQAESLEDLQGELAFWWGEGRDFVVRNWDLREFQRLVGFDRCGRKELDFLGAFVSLARSPRNASALFRGTALRKVIKARENRTRPRKCRLCGAAAHRRYLKQWGGPPNRWQEAFQLRYRHQVGETIVRDLLRKPYLRRSDVQD